MDRKTNLIPALLLSALSLYAMEDVKVTQFQHAGPFTVNKPILADSLNVNGKPFEAKNLLKATLPFEQTLANATVLDADTAGAITFAAPQKGYALHLFSFFLNSFENQLSLTGFLLFLGFGLLSVASVTGVSFDMVKLLFSFIKCLAFSV